MIKAILFDLGGVVLDISPQRTIDAFARLGLETGDYVNRSHHQGIFKEFELGLVDEDEFVQKLQDQLKEGVTRQEILSAWESMLVALPKERIELIQRLKEQYHLMILSNTNPVHISLFYQMGAEHADIEALFHQRFYSYEMGVSKPSDEIYQAVLDESDLKAEEILFIDDAQVNLDKADELGFQTRLITAEQCMIKALSPLLA